MLDQSFSAENFRTILDMENRKGVHVEKKLSMDSITRINEIICKCNEDIRIKKKEKDVTSVNNLYEAKKELRKQKEVELEKYLEQISSEVAKSNFKIQLKKINIPDSKPIYTIPNKPAEYFALKQIQRNISKLFNVKQTDRNAIIEQVLSLLGDKYPKYIIRTDIKDFYENIPHKQLFNIIYDDNLLSPVTKRLIRQILKFNDTNKGIPRGIGVSAYLAELFMRDIDDKIKSIKGVTYYARYVDDIIVMFTPPSNLQTEDYLDNISAIINEKELSLNGKKTKLINITRDMNKECLFQYLGYRFYFNNNDSAVKVSMTKSKIEKYKYRINKILECYSHSRNINEKKARKILVKRIRFLTGNAILTNNKNNIYVGIYYSNRCLNQLKILNMLDSYLNKEIAKTITNSDLKTRLLEYGFKRGFNPKIISPFTTKELAEITKAWKKYHY